MSLVLALDVGGSSVKSALIDRSFRTAAGFRETAFDSQGAADNVIGAFAAIVRHHLAAAIPSEVDGLAIGFPGPFDYDWGVSQIRGLAKFERLYGLEVGEMLRTALPEFDRPIVFGPDAEMGILGEANHGAGRPYRQLIGIGLGTGLGSAFVADGKVMREGRGVPEHGYLYALPWQGGIAEAVFSNRGLTDRLSRTGGEQLSPAEAAERARKGDLALRGAFQAFGAELGQFLRPHIQAFGAEVVLGLGGIARAHDLFFPSLQAAAGVPVLTSTTPVPAALLGLADHFRSSRTGK